MIEQDTRRAASPPASADSASAVELSLVPEDETFGRYTLRYRVAAGGMATVHLAQMHAAEGFQKWVAVKVIHPHLAWNKRFVQMFMNEARLAARIDHPNVCSVFDFGACAGTYFLAMEYLHGETLRSTTAAAQAGGATLPWTLGARIVADVARGLHAAHELTDAEGRSAGVVHRDVSPENIFVLYDGLSKVVDFGVARCNDHAGEATRTGELRGKAAYMSPEQVRGEAIDRRSDVFALGIVLWEVTLGRRLFRRETEPEKMNAVLTAEIPRPEALAPGYPAALADIVRRALERDRDARFQTADELARALDSFLAGCGAPAGAIQVADFMQATFAARIERRNALLRGAGPRPSQRPPAPARPGAEATQLTPTVTETPVRPTRARRTRWALVAALVVVGGVAGGSLRALSSRATSHAAASRASSEPRAVEVRPPAPPSAVSSAPSTPSLAAPHALATDAAVAPASAHGFVPVVPPPPALAAPRRAAPASSVEPTRAVVGSAGASRGARTPTTPAPSSTRTTPPSSTERPSELSPSAGPRHGAAAGAPTRTNAGMLPGYE